MITQHLRTGVQDGVTGTIRHDSLTFTIPIFHHFPSPQRQRTTHHNHVFLLKVPSSNHKAPTKPYQFKNNEDQEHNFSKKIAINAPSRRNHYLNHRRQHSSSFHPFSSTNARSPAPTSPQRPTHRSNGSSAFSSAPPKRSFLPERRLQPSGDQVLYCSIFTYRPRHRHARQNQITDNRSKWYSSARAGGCVQWLRSKRLALGLIKPRGTQR